MEKNRAEIAREQESLVQARKMVADFKRSLFDMYKGHLAMISAMPEADENDDEAETTAAEEEKKTAEEPAQSEESRPDPFATSQFSTRVIRGAYESRFSDLKFGENNQGAQESKES